MKTRIFIRLYAPLTLLCASLFSLSAFAFTNDRNFTDRAVLVPFANFTATETTAVPLVATRQGRVHWAFFDANGNRRAFDSFPVMEHEQYLFIWAEEAAATPTGAALANTPGYLLFAIDTNGDGRITNADFRALGASALHLSPRGAVFLSTQAVSHTQLTNPDPVNWTSFGVGSNSFGGTAFRSGESIFIQYLIDGAPGGDETKVYVWCDSPFTSLQTMTLDNGAGARQTFTYQMLNNHLNIIDVDSIPQVSPAFTGAGFIRWTLSNQAGGCTVFSVVDSPSILSSSLTLKAKRIVD